MQVGLVVLLPARAVENALAPAAELGLEEG
jgi:hypothetical protein